MIATAQRPRPYAVRAKGIVTVTGSSGTAGGRPDWRDDVAT